MLTRPRTAADTLLGRLQAATSPTTGCRTDPPPLDRRRPQRPGARLPRPHPPGRGAARGRRRPARRRPDPRAARRARHVPRRRDVRADHRGHLRARRRGRRRAPGGAAAGAAGRPGAAADQRAARRAVPAARARHRPAHRQPGARPRRHARGAAAVRVRRRRARAAARLDRRAPASGGASTATHRATWQLGDVEQGSWRDGLDRLLLGAAMEGALDSWGDVVPLDDVDSSDIDLAGRLAELVDRLAAAQAADGRAGTPRRTGWPGSRTRSAGWPPRRTTPPGSCCSCAASSPTSPRPPTAAPRCSASPTSARCSTDSLAGRPTRASFRTGTLTVCTLVPMRSVPHRVVCLLGLDDGVFPRQSSHDGDDVLARDPWVGERDPRSEDRQLLPRRHLRRRETTSSSPTPAPTSAPAHPCRRRSRSASCSTRSTARRPRPTAGGSVTSVTTHHPLQPFDPRNFARARSGPSGPFSFDPLVVRRCAVAAAHRASSRRPFLRARCRRVPPATSSSPTCMRLLAHPARGFLRQRLQVRRDPRARTSRPTRCRSSWTASSCGTSASGCCASGSPGLDPMACIELEQRRGSLPPGPLGVAVSAAGRAARSTSCSLPRPSERELAARVATTSTPCSPTAPG